MNATIAERLMNYEHVSDEQTRIDGFIFDRIVEVESPDDNPVAVFGCPVAPVVARLLSMPVPQ
jgi:hypothetical protein